MKDDFFVNFHYQWWIIFKKCRHRLLVLHSFPPWGKIYVVGSMTKRKILLCIRQVFLRHKVVQRKRYRLVLHWQREDHQNHPEIWEKKNNYKSKTRTEIWIINNRIFNLLYYIIYKTKCFSNNRNFNLISIIKIEIRMNGASEWKIYNLWYIILIDLYIYAHKT